MRFMNDGTKGMISSCGSPVHAITSPLCCESNPWVADAQPNDNYRACALLTRGVGESFKHLAELRTCPKDAVFRLCARYGEPATIGTTTFTLCIPA
jgi:hypothetical protein